ncbi:MAG: hypothetical protein FWE23_10790, partial [Chitinivibrionia bacterium]|nr:hypothetical protein [Chitinivibrionia bacterium]
GRKEKREARSEKREVRSEKREVRSEKREARSEKREARSEKREARIYINILNIKYVLPTAKVKTSGTFCPFLPITPIFILFSKGVRFL